MQKQIYILFVVAMALVSTNLVAQYNTHGMSGGVGIGATQGVTESSSNPGLVAHGYLRQGIVDHLQGELSLGIGKIGGENYNTTIVPLDAKLVYSPFVMETWNPFVFAGFGGVHYKVEQKPANASSKAELEKWAGNIPMGIGSQFRMDDMRAFEISAGYNLTNTADLDAVRTGTKKDGFWSIFLGLAATGASSDADPDHDGLPNSVEKQLGTDPNNPDSDGDGLSDGDEVNVYKTNPLNGDSDGDGLKDGDEIKIYKTDPNKADSDGDGLKDGDELNTYHTDPLKKDTDGDGLSDGDEVLRYHTDPLKTDTDGGTVDDGTEVGRGTNPLEMTDDVPKKEEPKKEEVKAPEPMKDISNVEKGQSIALEGILFETGSAKISASSEATLAKVVQTMTGNPDLEVEIQGHTDNKGKEAANVKLSQRRADAVKAFLVKKGVNTARMTAKGFGSSKPVATNDTQEGREKNRRIEFLRTK